MDTKPLPAITDSTEGPPGNRIRVRGPEEETRWDMPPLRVTPPPAALPVPYRPPGSRTVRGVPRNVTHQGAYQFWLPWGIIRRVPWLLLPVLALQAALATRLIWSSTAFSDEALYLWAGHLEWAHWLHGAAIPALPEYFSGAPVAYPPLAAIADSLGGLAGARLLSLAFMLGATSLLWATSSRLYGRMSAFFACVVFATLGTTIHLSTFATFDAMSLFFIALAAWCATAQRSNDDATWWMLGASAALCAANVTKYASISFDPIVLGLAVLSARPVNERKIALRRGALMLTCVTGLLAVLLRVAGLWYYIGITQTTTGRTAGTASVQLIVLEAARWVGVVAVLAAVAFSLAVLASRLGQSRALLALLLAAVLMVPLEQARIHTTTSLDKHVDFGAWFGAIAAGYAIYALCRVANRWQLITIVLALSSIMLYFITTVGMSQSRAMSKTWTSIGPSISGFKSLVTQTSGPLLVEDPSPLRYYLGPSISWQRWSSTWAVTLPSGKSIGSRGVTNAGNPAMYTKLINEGYFKIIALDFVATPALDHQLVNELAHDNSYRRIKAAEGGVSGYDVWVYAGRTR